MHQLLKTMESQNQLMVQIINQNTEIMAEFTERAEDENDALIRSCRSLDD
ncbi:hypothetical protein [Acinetobacter chinensis]|nr:hypothetical protein [Acinetobacter chinensis]